MILPPDITAKSEISEISEISKISENRKMDVSYV